MNDLFLFAAHNTVVALLLALVVFALTRVWHNPPLAHALWLLVLLKLVAPPVMRVDWSAVRLPEPTTVGDQIGMSVSRLEGRTTSSAAQKSATSDPGYDVAAILQPLWHRGGPVLFLLWLGGAAVCGLIAVTRIVRFERRLRDTLPAPERLERLTREIAGKIGVRRVPDVRYVERADVPMLWCAGCRPTIVLPMRLFRQLDDEQAALILAHELAHLRRHDHWVRIVELIVSSVYWWNPLVWMVRRQVHDAEDLCCDAWVRWAFPDCTRRYAEVVLLAAESLTEPQVDARLLPASPFLHSLSLKARIEMILESRFAPYVSTRSTVVMAILAFVVLPSFVQITKTEAVAAANDETAAAAPNAAPAEKLDTQANSDYPHTIKFEQGATQFAAGDNITIDEIHGTAETFVPGNKYLIKGTYTLGSHDRAALSAFTTAADAANGRSPIQEIQTTAVKQGKGTFTLILPMSCRGWPHISFYPAEGGSSFGGNYFGTGDSVLKKWWGSKEKIDKVD